MNVLMTVDTVGGVFTYALELAAALAARGAAVALAAKGGVLSDDQWSEARRVPALEVFESADRPEWMDDPWDDVARSSAWLLGLEERLRPDVVHLNEYAHGALPFRAPAVVVGHSCVCSWFEAVHGAPPPPSFERYRREVAKGLASASMVIAPTRWMLSALERHYGALPRGRVVPNGRCPRRFPPGEKEPFVLCAGRLWDEAKNAAVLDAAAERLRWPVLLAGEDEHPDPAHAGRVAPRHARPLGRLSPAALSAFYGRAAVYCAPARYEPFGLSILEAALAGCALVLGDLPSLRETWDGAAAFVDPGSADQLAAMLSGLQDREDLAAEMGARARARALSLSPERMADGYLAAYAAVLAERAQAEEADPCAS
ncbi:MAG TPA: glycosyltransferase family 4 protein [Anaeromyxobacteraceae bacterium]|nr:glycosyltransferase family 4 protein [Anaeromyxobacteraceae bacterium]